MIRYGRGRITILSDRELKNRVCECYAAVRRESARSAIPLPRYSELRAYGAVSAGRAGETLAALGEHGAVYLNAIGGAAQFYARAITQVDGVSLLEFGTPEAMWHLQVKDFPAIVTMDAHGNSLHKDIEQDSGKVLEMIGG